LAAFLTFLAASPRAQAPVSVTSTAIVYDEKADAPAELAAALARASAEHKRVIVDFGANWCGDCLALDGNFHRPENEALLTSDFVLVHVNIGHIDENLDIAKRYGVPLDKGVPALAVLSEHGKLLYSQKQGEFEAMRHMESSSVTRFLVQWRPERSGCSAVVVNC